MGSRRGDIQGLRALAVLLVVLCHAGVGGLTGGFVGVDVFFVVSGFLITGLLLAEADRNGRISFVGFYARRARRILPAAAVTLVSTALAATWLLNFVRAREVVWDSVFAASFAANVRFAEQGTDYFAAADPPSPLLHFWSLAVEEQFYLVWPALLAVVLARRFGGGAAAGRRRLLFVVAAIAAASLAWSVHLTRALPTEAYFSTLTRAWELGVGALLALTASRWSRLGPRLACVTGWIGMAAVVLAAIAYDDATPFPGVAAVLPVAGTALVLGAGISNLQSRVAVGRWLALPPLRAIGDRSYSLYLWHWPVLVLAEQYAERRLAGGTNLALVLGAYGLACVSYAVVERPIHRAPWKARGALTVAAASGAAVFLATAVALAAVDRDAGRFVAARTEPVIRTTPVSRTTSVQRDETRIVAALPEVVSAVRAAERSEPIPPALTPPLTSLRHDWDPWALPRGCVPIARSYEWSSRLCRLADATSRKSIVLIGDSHAQGWLPPLLRIARLDGWAVIPILRPGCTPETWLTNRGLDACRLWYRWAIEQIRSLRPNVTLVTGALSDSWGPRVPLAVNGMLALAKTLRGASRRVAIIGDPEGLRRDPLDCLLSRRASLRRCMATWWPHRLDGYDTVARRAKRASVGFVDTRGWFCFDRRCPAVVGRTIVYFDRHHVTAEYALRLSAVFRAAFKGAIRPR